MSWFQYSNTDLKFLFSGTVIEYISVIINHQLKCLWSFVIVTLGNKYSIHESDKRYFTETCPVGIYLRLAALLKNKNNKCNSWVEFSEWLSILGVSIPSTSLIEKKKWRVLTWLSRRGCWCGGGRTRVIDPETARKSSQMRPGMMSEDKISSPTYCTKD